MLNVIKRDPNTLKSLRCQTIFHVFPDHWRQQATHPIPFHRNTSLTFGNVALQTQACTRFKSDSICRGAGRKWVGVEGGHHWVNKRQVLYCKRQLPWSSHTDCIQRDLLGAAGVGNALAEEFVSYGDSIVVSSRSEARVQSAVKRLEGLKKGGSLVKVRPLEWSDGIQTMTDMCTATKQL